MKQGVDIDNNELIKFLIDLGYDTDSALDLFLSDPSKAKTIYLSKKQKELEAERHNINRRNLWGLYVNDEFVQSVLFHNHTNEMISDIVLKNFEDDKYDLKIDFEDKLIKVWLKKE